MTRRPVDTVFANAVIVLVPRQNLSGKRSRPRAYRRPSKGPCRSTPQPRFSGHLGPNRGTQFAEVLSGSHERFDRRCVLCRQRVGASAWPDPGSRPVGLNLIRTDPATGTLPGDIGREPGEEIENARDGALSAPNDPNDRPSPVSHNSVPPYRLRPSSRPWADVIDANDVQHPGHWRPDPANDSIAPPKRQPQLTRRRRLRENIQHAESRVLPLAPLARNIT